MYITKEKIITGLHIANSKCYPQSESWIPYGDYGYRYFGVTRSVFLKNVGKIWTENFKLSCFELYTRIYALLPTRLLHDTVQEYLEIISFLTPHIVHLFHAYCLILVLKNIIQSSFSILLLYCYFYRLHNTIYICFRVTQKALRLPLFSYLCSSPQQIWTD